jgi:O-antigen/teichoic acid export membrane protein
LQTEANFPLEAADAAASTSSASIIGRIGKGFGALSIGAAVQIIGQISIVPVALYAWGKIRYGEWILLTGLVTLLRLTDLGLQTFVVNRLCSSYARGERDQMERELHSALRVQIPLVLGVAALCIGILYALPMQRVLNLQTVNVSTLRIVASLLVIELLIGVPMGVIAGVYRATGQLARAGIIGATQQFLILTSTIALIAWGSGFVILSAVRVLVAVLATFWILFDLRKLYSWLHLWPSAGDWREGVRMIGPGLFFIMIPLADYLSTQFTLVVLQHSLDGGEVSRLTTHRTVVNLAMMVSGLLASAVWPELTALHARSEHILLAKTHRSLARMNMWLVGAITFGMLPFIPLIYPSWTAGRLTVDRWTLGFLITRMLIWGVWSASMTMLCAINKQKLVAVVLLAAAAVTSVLSIWLIPKIGISGAALAQLIGDLSVSAWVIPWLASRETKDNYAAFMGKTAMALIKGLLIPVGLGLLGWRLIGSEVVRLTVLVPAVSALAVAMMWTQLAEYEKNHLVGLVRARFAH